MPLTVLTRELDEARRCLGDARDATIKSVQYRDVPRELYSHDVGLCLVKPSFSKVASTPTRFAEFLAAGMPVAVTAGVGDLETVVERHGVGVVLREDTEESLAAAASSMREIAEDPVVCDRCRRVARDEYGVDVGVRRYHEIYERLVRPRS
jgi:glycosyltransferase involved in cell wall biosynthesis